jgi:hypothetical protein
MLRCQFFGFKIQNSIVALDNIYQAEAAKCCKPRRKPCKLLTTTLVCIRHKTVELLKENQKKHQATGN